MKTVIVGRKIEVRWKHFIAAAAIDISFSIAVLIISFGLAYALSGSLDGIVYVSPYIEGVLAVIQAPLMASIFLRFIDKDAELKSACRSMAGGLFIAPIVLYLLVLVLSVIGFSIIPSSAAESFWPYFMYAPLWIVETIFDAAGSAILLYLWMLLLAKPDTRRVRSAIFNGGVVAFLLFLLKYSALFLISYSNSQVFVPVIGFAEAAGFLGIWALAIVLLYHTTGKKLDWKAAWFCAAAIVGEPILRFVAALFISSPATALSNGTVAAEMILALVLVYLVSQKWDEKF